MQGNSQLRLKLEDTMDSAAQALEKAQRVLSARATPRPPTTLVSVAEPRFEALRAEITTLKAVSDRDLAAMESRRRIVESASTALDLAQSAIQQKSREIDDLTAAHERERTELRAEIEVLRGQLEGLHSANAKEREALKKDRELLTTDRALLAAETQTAHNVIQGERQAIAQQLHRMLQTIQPNSFAPSAEPTSLLPPSPIPSPTIPTAHLGESPNISGRRPECDTSQLIHPILAA
ncbi:hypothetical protein FB451DRAFT_707054 [Mycena latifolia]|nr:hypothetical protein FB451DRAFT_707054 [Mycena latifolia]